MLAVPLRREKEDLIRNNKIEMERLKERKELEKDKIILETERKYADEMTKMNAEYNETIKLLYGEINTFRKEYVEKINRLQEEHKAELAKVNGKKP